MNEDEMKGQINAVKAMSFDQITSLNAQLSAVKQQVDQQNALLQQIVSIASPDDNNLTIEQLLGKLRDAFAPTTDGENDD